jgi:hypothetical protein
MPTPLTNPPRRRPVTGEKHPAAPPVEDEMFRPMTLAELNAMIDEAEDDIRNNRHISHEEMLRWIDGLA